MIVYVDPDLPGISRKKERLGWSYWDAKGKRITNREEIDRLNAIGLPPAYKDAWFCPSVTGHIQAIGYDDRGRKQYRYHVDFRAKQDAAKYDRCSAFGRALPLLRARVEADLAGKPTQRDAVLAAVVRLLDIARIRVGNESYAKENKSFGATTLRSRHAKVAGSKLSLQYRAKSGILRKLTISDKGLLRVVRRVQDLPGQNLFQYLDADGTPHPVGSADVNAYIRAATGDDFTAKHFRTWSASTIAFQALAAAQDRIGLKTMLVPVTEALGNTPAIARKSYVHPALIELTREGQEEFRASLDLPRATRYLDRYERGLIAFLEAGEKASGTKKAA